MLLQARERARMVTHSGALAALLPAFAAPLRLARFLALLVCLLAFFMALLALLRALLALGGRPLRLRRGTLRLRCGSLHLGFRTPLHLRSLRRPAQHLVALFRAALLRAPDLGAASRLEFCIALAHFRNAVGHAAAVRRIMLPVVALDD